MSTTTASCGHQLAPHEDTVVVRYGASECDAIEGYSAAVAYVSFCPACAENAKSWPEYLADGVPDEWWFSVGYDEWLSSSKPKISSET